MKIKLMSDIHLEFPRSDVELTRNDADVLILAGDICTTRNMEDFMPFFERAAQEFPHVIYIAGNHESYGGYIFGEDGQYVKRYRALANIDNIHVLSAEDTTINGINIWAGTLWTDANKNDYITKRVIQRDINDFRVIKMGSSEKPNARFTPDDMVIRHEYELSQLKHFLRYNGGKPCVVVTHHAPSKQSTNSKYKTEFHMNGAYSSDLSALIAAHPEIKLWCHGHTHDSFDYVEGSTRILCNPAGYPIRGRDGKLYRENPDFNPKLVVEI